MAGQAAEKPLYDAASKGDLLSFQQLLQGDPYLLDGVSFAGSRNLLHIATLYGQAAIVEEVLRIHPRLARSLDSENSTALHIAAAEGNLEITKKLLRIAPETCWWCDCHDMNPIHVAAINGHVEILEELIAVDPSPAMEKVGRGYTVLHLCVKHRQLRVLQFLVNKLGDSLVRTKDDDGETLLHLAAACNEFEMIKFLVNNTQIEKKSRDSMGRTAWDMVGIPLDPTTFLETRELLRVWPNFPIELNEMFRKMSEAMMVVLGLIATMAFQSAVSPPGGVWQDDSSTHKAGEAVMASTDAYKGFLRANTTAFFSSLATIALLMYDRVHQNPFMFIGVIFSMMASMFSLSASYGLTVNIITPENEDESLKHALKVALPVSLVPIVFYYVGIYFENPARRSKIRKLLGLRPYQTVTQI